MNIKIEGINVDEKLFTTKFEGCNNCKGECCSCGVAMSKLEINRVNNHLKFILKYLPTKNIEIIKNRWYHTNRNEGNSNEIYNRTRKVNGMCIFSYVKNNKYLCAIHSYCLKSNISLQYLKPLACLLAPLSGEEDIKDIKVSAYTCNKHKNTNCYYFDDNLLMETIRYLYGNNVYNRIKAYGNQLKHKIVIL